MLMIITQTLKISLNITELILILTLGIKLTMEIIAIAIVIALMFVVVGLREGRKESKRKNLNHEEGECISPEELEIARNMRKG